MTCVVAKRDKPEWQQIAGTVPIGLHRRVKARAAELGLSLGEILTEALQQWLDKQQSEEGSGGTE